MNDDQNDHEERCSIDEASPEIHEPSVSVYRKIIVVILLCAINGGVRFCAQNIVPLQDVITENMRLTEVQYNAISSFYSIPNIFLLIIMGFAVDKLGHQLFTVIFTVCCLCGQTLICLGIRQNMYYLLMSGRLMFGYMA
ncbi:Major facilitator superfamily domain-containing protein 1 [Thelohanellus kitauei]|uniref:Major facilitator superfamily domain-containing protein 1 n=1 Tax=Thelohanellus kitauei TaxID=669202 RepID=A0A0C2NAH0_THEKT|nr:Major facilitator superfamily domain-containing protein 1 [Thelohanellus kitauei]